MDHGFTKPKEPWEMSDGAIFLLRECSAIESQHQLVISNLENLSALAYIDTFKHSNTLRENLFKSMSTILKNLGKKKFRGYVELFLDPTFRVSKSLDHQNTNMSVSAQDLILAFDSTYGENIFKAIVEGHDDRLVGDLVRIKEEGERFRTQDFVYPHAAHLPTS